MLEGDLADFPLPDVLRLLAATSKTGRLELRADQRSGRIELAEGRLLDASAHTAQNRLARRLIGRGRLDAATLRTVVDGALPTDRELAAVLVEREVVEPDEAAAALAEQVHDAVFDLLAWHVGHFRFESRPVEADRHEPDVLEHSWPIADVLDEADQRLAAWDDVLARTGDGSDVVAVRRPADGTVDVDAFGWQLIGLADGRRTVDQLVELTGRGRCDTRRTLAQLLDLGVVTIGPSAAEGDVQGLLAAHAVLAEFEGGAAQPVAAPGPESATSEPAAEEAGQPAAGDVPVAPRANGEAAAPDGVGAGSRTSPGRSDEPLDEDLIERLIAGIEDR